jgi:hypothetical protein
MMQRYLRTHLLRPSDSLIDLARTKTKGTAAVARSLKQCLGVSRKETGDTFKTRSIEGTNLDQPVDGVATILEEETQAAINDWFQRSMANNLLVSIPLEDSLRTSHLPDLFRDLVNRLRNPLPGSALLSPGAPAHGLLRRQQGYTAAMLIEEARMLEVSIFHTFRSNAHRIDFNVLLPDVMLIADEVDSQLAQAMASYTSV